MSKKIREHNPKEFLEDLNRVRDVMVYAHATKEYFKAYKCDIRRTAETQKIHYYLTDKVFKNRRTVIVIL